MGESLCFTVDGVERYTGEDKPLPCYLRDDLHPHPVKNGCSEGACGTYTIVVNGEAVESCALTTKRAVGKNITTTEGLSDAEKEAFVYAFGAMRSIQYGFRTSGMVTAGKALVNRVPNPTEEETKVALKGSICHYTGYKKVIEGIQLTTAILRGDARIEGSLEKGDECGVGRRALRLDVREKVLGYGEYPDGVVMERMIYASAIHSRYPWARVLDINYEKAAMLPDVLVVFTAEDAPDNKVGHLQQDWDVMVVKGGITRCVGDAICLVVAESRDILEKTKRTVKIDYKELGPICSVQEAMAKGVPEVHEKGDLRQSRHVTRGDAKKILGNSRHMVTQAYRTPFTKHAFLEPECVVTFPHKNGVKVYSTDQGVYDIRKEISIMLDWDPGRVVMESKLVGGGSDGKEDISAQHIAAPAALKVQRPIKVVFSKQESPSFYPERHVMGGTFALGCDRDSIFTGLDCKTYSDTGAYVSLYGPMFERTYTHFVGPYYYQNTGIYGFDYHTDSPPTGTFRGFGTCQSEPALGSSIDLLAEKMRTSPQEIRYRNAIEPDKVLPNGQTTDCSTVLKEALLAVRDAYESSPERAKIAYTAKNAGVDVGLLGKGRVKLAIHDERTRLYDTASNTRQGYAIVFVQMVPEATSFGKGLVRNMGANSEAAPDSGTTSGSRQTLITGKAIRMTAADLNEILQEAGRDLNQLEGREFFAEFFDPTDKLGVNIPNPKSHVAYGFATHVMMLDDDGRVKEVHAAHDFGKAVSPISIQGQVEGGVLMGPGYALTKDSPLKNGVPQAKYSILGPMRFTQIPGIHAIHVEEEELLPFVYGTKGVGEIVTMPTTPAAQGVYYAKDHILQTALPMDDTCYSKRK